MRSRRVPSTELLSPGCLGCIGKEVFLLTNLEVLPTLSFCASIEASLPRRDWLNPWTTVINSTTVSPLFTPWRLEDGAEILNPLTSLLVPLATSSNTYRLSKSHFIGINSGMNNKRHLPLYPLSLRKFQGYQKPNVRNGRKIVYVCLSINNNITKGDHLKAYT